MSCGATDLSRGHRAAEYYRSRNVPERLEHALNSTFLLDPEDVYGHLANYFAEFSKPPVISDIRGRKVLDGTGKVTLEVEVLCTVRNADKRICSTVISADTESAPLLTDDVVEANEKERLKSVETAIGWIQDYISSLLKGIQPNDQSKVDQLLSDYLKPKKEEERERRSSDREIAPTPTMSIPSSAASPPSSKKKRSGKGKKAAATEKPIPPAEPLEPPTRGSIAIGAVSLAVAKSNAVLSNIPLYSYISAIKRQQPPTELVMPTPLITLLSYGKSSPGKLNLMKEVMVIPKPGAMTRQAKPSSLSQAAIDDPVESLDMASSLQMQILKQVDGVCKSGQSVIKSISPLGCPVLGCDRTDQPLDLIRDACQHLGLELGTDVHLAINCAAHELMDYNKGKYEVVSGTWKSPDEMVDLYVDLMNKHPSIMALVDPLRREDRQQWETLGKAVGSRCYLMADAASRTVSHLLEAGIIPHSSGPILKYTDETTMSNLLAVVRLIEEEKRVTILGCTYEECTGDSIVDLAVGLCVRFIKLGGLLRGERTTKYNRLLAIEEELAHSGMLGSHSEFKFPALWSEPQNLTTPEETNVKC